MSKEDFYKVVLYCVNVLYALFGIATAATGIWFFVQVNELVSLRNTNHYLLDYRVYWPQAAPWLFIILGLFIMTIAFCGWCGAQRESKGMLGIYTTFLLIIIFAQLIIATLVFVFVDGEDTDRFIKDTVYDAFLHTKEDPEALKAFGRFERKLRCCGANDARDYKSWRNDLPITCCTDSTGYSFLGPSPVLQGAYGSSYSGSSYGSSSYGSSSYDNTYGSFGTDQYGRSLCDFTNKEANERYGCAKVASVYSKIISSIIAGISLLMVVVEIVGAVISYKLFKRFGYDEHYIEEKKEGETEC